MCLRTFDLQNVRAGRVGELRYHLVKWFLKISLWLMDLLWDCDKKYIDLHYPKCTYAHDIQTTAFSFGVFMEPQRPSWIKKSFHFINGKLRLREVGWHGVESWEWFPMGWTAVWAEESGPWVNPAETQWQTEGVQGNGLQLHLLWREKETWGRSGGCPL